MCFNSLVIQGPKLKGMILLLMQTCALRGGITKVELRFQGAAPISDASCGIRVEGLSISGPFRCSPTLPMR